jgi:hypothetical protein
MFYVLNFMLPAYKQNFAELPAQQNGLAGFPLNI